jgi:hypothetical protein
MGPVRRGALLVLALALPALARAPAAAQGPAAAEVRGRITARAQAPGGVPLAYALVELRVPGDVHTVLTDADGRYRFPDVPAGAASLRAHYLGHRPRVLEVLVPPSGAVGVDLELETEAVPIPGITVTADPFRVPDPDGAGPLTPATAGAAVELALLEITPGLAEVALAPGSGTGGGREPSDPRQVLLMRGSTADLKLVLLDGAPVYTPFHLGGLLESFDPAALGHAAHHVGGAPARYDGGLSYILDLETRRPGTHTGGRAAVDLMSARAAGEVAIGGGGLLASGRALHNAGPRLLEGVASPYGYVDGLLRAAVPVAGADLSLTLFGNREEVRLGNERMPLAPEAARWGNGVASARLTHSVGSTALRWTAAASRYDAELPLRTDSSTEESPVLARGETGRLRLAVEAERELGSGTLRFGASADRTDVHYASRQLTRSGVVRTDARTDGDVVGIHTELQRPLGSRVIGRLGGRVDHFDPGGTRTGLRGALSWSITPEAVLSLSAGRYHQLTRATDSDLETALIPEASTPGPGETETPFLTVSTSDHVVLGLDQRLGSSGVELGLRGFVKRFSGVEGLERILHSSGVDLRLQALAGPRTGWLGYALSWSWESDAPGSADRFTGRHLLSAGLQRRAALHGGPARGERRRGPARPRRRVPEPRLGARPLGRRRRLPAPRRGAVRGMGDRAGRAQRATQALPAAPERARSARRALLLLRAVAGCGADAAGAPPCAAGRGDRLGVLINPRCRAAQCRSAERRISRRGASLSWSREPGTPP